MHTPYARYTFFFDVWLTRPPFFRYKTPVQHSGVQERDNLEMISRRIVGNDGGMKKGDILWKRHFDEPVRVSGFAPLERFKKFRMMGLRIG